MNVNHLIRYYDSPFSLKFNELIFFCEKLPEKGFGNARKALLYQEVVQKELGDSSKCLISNTLSVCFFNSN